MLLYSSLSISQWVHQNSGTNGSLSSVCFINQNTGWVLGMDSINTIILKTTNGGTNWIYSSNSNYLNAVQFINQNTGWIVGHMDTWPNYGKVLKSTNGGLNWQNQLNLLYSYLSFVQFIDQNTGWVVGKYNVPPRVLILKTTNGGNNWFSQDIGLNFTTNLNSIYFVNQNTGWVAGGSNVPYDTAIILKTTNSGMNWFEQKSIPLNSFYSIFFIDQNTGWTAGFDGWAYNSTILKTTNSGMNWIYQDSAAFNNLQLKSIFFTNQVSGYAVGSAGIIKSIYGGTNWFYQDTVNFDSALNSVYFVDQNTGWAVGNNGNILKTTNGGNPIGIFPISKNIPVHFKLNQNYPNPFNPSTNIEFDLPAIANGISSIIKLAIFDVLGREIAILVNEKLQPGTHEVKWDASKYPSGVYFYKLETNDFMETKKMLLIK
jgi:photosystem II stability/assembly factor-like uncharacterized protein